MRQLFRFMAALLLISPLAAQVVQPPSGGGGGGSLNPGTKGQTVYYAADGSIGSAISAGVLVPPSGDTTGATDGVNIAAACTATHSVVLAAGAYHIGASNTSITIGTPGCKIIGQGPATILTNHGTTNNLFVINYVTTWIEGPGWVYPDSTKQTELANFQLAQSSTPSAGYAFVIGSGIPASGATLSYTMNVHIHDVVMNGLWGGVSLIDSELYAFVDHNMWRNFVGGGAVNYNACLGSGDNHISDNEFSGLANSGIIIRCADTTMFAHDKLNGSGITFTGAAEAKTVQFTDLSVETGITQPCAYDFGTGTAPTNVQINGGEQLGFTTLFCHPANVGGLAFNLANSASTTDYAAGLITNNGYATVSFPPAVAYQDLATFVGTVGTLLSAYTTQAGKTFIQYTGDGVTPQAMPTLNGSGKETVAAASTYGDVLDTLTPASADYTVGETFTLTNTTDQIGVFGRALSGSNTNYVCIYDGLGNLDLFAQYSGTFSNLGTVAYTWGTTHTMTLSMTGTAIVCSVDGTPQISVTDSHVTATGQAGSRIYSVAGGGATGTSFFVQ